MKASSREENFRLNVISFVDIVQKNVNVHELLAPVFHVVYYYITRWSALCMTFASKTDG